MGLKRSARSGLFLVCCFTLAQSQWNVNNNYGGQPGYNTPAPYQNANSQYGQQPQQQGSSYNQQQQYGQPSSSYNNPYSPQQPNQQGSQFGFGPQQQSTNVRPGTPLRFCTVSKQEKTDCEKMKYDLKNQNVRSGTDFRQKRQADSRKPIVRFDIQCIEGHDKMDCMKMIGVDNRADVVFATPGEAFVGGKEYNLIPLMYEIIGNENKERFDAEDQVIAVVRSDRGIENINQLRGKSACFGAVGDPVTWDLVASYFKSQNQIQTPKCEESYMDSFARYFGDICAPYDTHNYTAEENDRYRKICALCASQNCPPMSSVNKDFPINCLVQNPRVDVAFVSASALREALARKTFPNPEQYQALCPEGSLTGGLPIPLNMGASTTQSLEEMMECNIGRVPSSVYLTRANAENFFEMANFLQKIPYSFGLNSGQRSQWLENYFSGKYTDGQRVRDYHIYQNPQEATIENYLTGYRPYLEDSGICSQQEKVKWCTTSKADQDKCENMKRAFKTYRIRPELQCDAPVRNPYICLDKVYRNQSDVTMIDVGDLVVAGSHFNAIQLAQERYLIKDDNFGGGQNIFEEPYSVAVVKDAGLRSLENLRGKKACFSGLWEAHSFVLPVTALKDHGLVERGSCNYIDQVINFFGDSCLPGMADTEINTKNEPKDKMCKICEGGERGCSRNGDSKYAGQIGALNCLRDGKGDVAFVSHTALAEIPQEQRYMYFLVCSGTGQGLGQSLENYQSCNLGKAPGNVLVTSRYKSAREKRRLSEMILTASRLFSADISVGFQNQRSALLPFVSGSTDRSRKTYNMFGKRNRTDATISSSFGNPYGPGQQVDLGSRQDVGYYALFSPSAYDFRGFGDVNTTQVSDALQSYRYTAELTNWKRCLETGAASRIPVTGVLITSLFLVTRYFLGIFS